MTKWIAIAALVIGGLLVWKFAPVSGGGSASSKDTLAYVPADTALYIGGSTSQELADFVKDYALFPSTPTQTAQWQVMFDEIAGQDEPAAKFFSSLQRQMKEAGSSTLASMFETAGLSNSGAYALYLHGALPVIQLPLANPDAFNSMIETAVSDSNFTYTKAAMGNADVRLWRLTKPEDSLTFDLALAIDGKQLSITLLTGKDDETMKLERIGQSKPAKSLATTGEIDALRKSYGFNEYMISLIHIERLIQGFINPESNSFGRDLKRLIPEDEQDFLNSELSDACRTDYASLAASVPRFVGGYTDLSIKNNSLLSNATFVVEMTNQATTAELTKIRGHLPQHTLDASDKLITIGMGLDMDQLVPAITALWNQFTQAPYTCENLVGMQEQAKQTSPAMLAMAMGMAQGVKGLGVSFYDIEMSPMMMPSSLNFLASIASENPSTLAALTSMIPVPGLNNLVIPTDGSAVAVPVPMLPPSIEVKAAIKGKHLVLYAGEKAEAEVAKMENEALTASGLYSVGVNYRRAGELLELQSQGVFAQGGAEGCIAQQEMLHIMSNLKMDFTIVQDATSAGLETSVTADMDKPTTQALNPAGTYEVSMLDETCNWGSTDEEVISADGTGSIVGKSFDGSCNTYENEYTWVNNGNMITMTTTSDKYRETCEGEWETNENTTFDCHLLNINDTGFQCLLEPGTPNAQIYQYTRK